MEDVKHTKSENEFWTKKYIEKQTGWDIGTPSTPLKEYIDQLKNKDIRILIPGAGNAYEAEYLHRNGFKNVYVLDISKEPLRTFKERVPSFPLEQLLLGNFFEHEGEYDLILEQTFFCSFPPLKENRTLYAEKMNELLNKEGKLVGLWFNIPLKGDLIKRPFGGNKEEYLGYFSPFFDIQVFENCYNSIKPRLGNELFGIFKKKS